MRIVVSVIIITALIFLVEMGVSLLLNIRRIFVVGIGQ